MSGEKSSDWRNFWAAILIVGAIFLCVKGCLDSTDRDGGGFETTDFWPPTVGEEGVLDSGEGDGGVLVSATKEAWEQFRKAVIAKDKVGFYALYLSKQVFSVPKGTRVLVIDRALSAREVRIMEGEHTWKSGWVHEKWVRR